MDVSVIVPLYNGKKYVNKIIDMVDRNAGRLTVKKDIEIIFVNDCPEENVCLENKKNSIQINLICNSHNMGIHRSRISGLNAAKGTYVLFLDQDDEIKDDYLNTQFMCIGDADAVLCNGWCRNGRLIYEDILKQERAVNDKVYISEQNNIVSPGQILLKKESIPEDYKKHILNENGSDDVLLWLLMFRDKKKFKINTMCEYVHNENGKNASLDFVNMKKSVEEYVQVVFKGKLLDDYSMEIFKQGALNRIRKYDIYIVLLEHWDSIIGRLCEILADENFQNIAIYGFGVIGKRLMHDLNERGIKIECVIDERKSAFREVEVDIYSICEIPQKIECIIITPLFAEDEIKENLKSWAGTRISLRELIK